MKKFLSMMLMLAIATFSLTACGSDDEGNDSGLIGSWYTTDVDEVGLYGGYIVYTFTNTTLTATLLVQKEDGIWYKYPAETVNITIQGNKITTSGGDAVTVTYSIKGSTLTLTEDGEDGDFITFKRITSQIQSILDKAKVYENEIN